MLRVKWLEKFFIRGNGIANMESDHKVRNCVVKEARTWASKGAKSE